MRRLTAQLRHDTAVPAPPPAPAAKKVASWILTSPGKLTGDDRATLAQITARSAELAATRDLVRELANMLCHQRGEHLESWAGQGETSPISELRGFSKGLRKDWAAVTAGLTTPYSSGAVEGHVNRIKCSNARCTGARHLPGHNKPVTQHCCEAMTRQVDWHCDTHADRYDCADALISFTAKFREYGLIIHDGGTSSIIISYCPWCGARLPESQRDRWFDEMERRGINPWTSSVPAEFDDDRPAGGRD